MFSKIKLNLKISTKNYEKNKQVRALMPNLIHSLDATSLNLLFEQITNVYNNSKPIQFYSVHDCFGTTCDKVFTLKTILASVYTDLYSSEPYLYKFDIQLLDTLENSTNYKLDHVTRQIELPSIKYNIHDIDWVMNKKTIDS